MKYVGTTKYVEYVTDEIMSVEQRHAGALSNYATKNRSSGRAANTTYKHAGARASKYNILIP